MTEADVDCLKTRHFFTPHQGLSSVMQSHDITPISEAQIQSIIGVKLPIVDAYLSPDDKAMVIIPLGEIAIALLVAAKYEESKLWKPTLKRASAVSAMSTVHFPISAGAYTSEAINS